jgi:hypothetical protein
MKPLSRLESLIAEILERPAWTLSPHKLRPLELTAALIKALERRAVRLVDRVLAPDRYEVSVHPDDLSAFGDTGRVLERELADYLGRTITERDLTCNRPPSVRLVADKSVRPGRVHVTAAFTARPDLRGDISGGFTRLSASAASRRSGTPVAMSGRDNPITGARPDAILEVLDGSGRTAQDFPVNGTPAIVGRRHDVTVPLLDSKVSREHARIDLTAAGYTITDLQSLNGTLVNDREIAGTVALRDGDLIDIGHFRLRFRQRGSSQ